MTDQENTDMPGKCILLQVYLTVAEHKRTDEHNQSARHCLPQITSHACLHWSYLSSNACVGQGTNRLSSHTKIISMQCDYVMEQGSTNCYGHTVGMTTIHARIFQHGRSLRDVLEDLVTVVKQLVSTNQLEASGFITRPLSIKASYPIL